MISSCERQPPGTTRIEHSTCQVAFTCHGTKNPKGTLNAENPLNRNPRNLLNFLNLLNPYDRSETSSLSKRIVVIEKERVLARDPRRTLDFRHERRVVGDDGAVQRAAAEERAGKAFVHEGLMIGQQAHRVEDGHHRGRAGDRKSTRLNSSHSQISYAVFCLKKKTTHHTR